MGKQVMKVFVIPAKAGIHAFILAGYLVWTPAFAGDKHCLSLYDPCKYTAGFDHFDYVTPDAPKRGTVKLAGTGTFDSVNPFILKGVKAPDVGIIFDTLMVASQDEPQSMYGLIAQTADVAADKGSVVFTLNKAAKFHDGSAITADDVVFSFKTLKEKGDPTYRIIFAPIASAEKLSSAKVKFTFTDKTNREAPLIAGSLPVISKAYYSKVAFDKTTFDSPLGSGAYKIAAVDAGRSIIFERAKDYWAENLPVNRGQHNFDTIRYDMYRDENVTLEAFKSGQFDFRQEYIARNWATAYDHPAVKDGRIIKRPVPDLRPQGMQSFVFNSRKDKFADRRVREAITLAMDYEWLNKTIFYNAYVRNKSFFGNTDFEAKDTPSAGEMAILSPFSCHSDESRNPDSLKKMDPDLHRDDGYCVPPALFERAYAPPVTDGSGNPRESLLKAQALLDEAGWVVKDGKRTNAKGEVLSIEFMLRQPTMERVIGPMRKNLERLGIVSSMRIVDDSQYQKRVDEADFDMVSIWINRGLFYPGNEQMALWHSSQADVKGGNNLAGLKNPAVDAALAALINAKGKDELVAAGRALDRVLLWENVVIPNWQSANIRVAYWDKFGIPATIPKYNLGFDSWWVK